MIKRWFVTFLAALLLSFSAVADTWIQGKVIFVSDGDTATVVDERGKKRNIRFYGVDTPESEWPGHWEQQPFSDKAKDFTRKVLKGQSVKVRLTGDVTYGREVGEIYLGQRSVSEMLVEKGLAWWYERYAPNEQRFSNRQKVAKVSGRGLWSQNNPIPPWDWRRR